MTSAAVSYKRDPDEKRDRIAQAARALFAERGFAGTTTAEIAARAAVSEGIVFHHFGSKRELFASVAAGYGRGLAEAMFGESPGDVVVAPEQAIARAFDYVRENRPLHRVFMVRDPELAALVHEGTRAEIVGALEAHFANGAEKGLMRPMNARVVAELIYALVGGALDACFAEHDGEREAEYLSEAVRCVRGAVSPLANESPDSHPRSEA